MVITEQHHKKQHKNRMMPPFQNVKLIHIEAAPNEDVPDFAAPPARGQPYQHLRGLRRATNRRQAQNSARCAASTASELLTIATNAITTLSVAATTDSTGECRSTRRSASSTSQQLDRVVRSGIEVGNMRK